MINSVEMINWRAYERRKVTFGPGITFIMGANGVGKTSILEAIAYALIGRASTVSVNAKLVRDPSQPATVCLSFTVDGRSYLVERSLSSGRAGSAKLMQEGVSKPLASSHKAVTEQVERLMSVSEDFLHRIVYMAEGDVFRFLNDPPSEALDVQIRRVLGLTQLDEFSDSIETAERELKTHVADAQRLLTQFEEQDIREEKDLAGRLQTLEGNRHSLLASLRAAQSEIEQLKRENQDLLRLSPLLQRGLQVLRQYPPLVQTAEQMPILSLFADLERKIEESQSRLQDHRASLARLDGEEKAYQRIRDALEPYVGSTETVPCPVCRKPMTVQERELALQDAMAGLHSIDKDRNAHTQQRDESDRVLGGLKKQVEGLRELRNFLTHVSLRAVGPSARISDLQDVSGTEIRKLQDHLKGLQEQASTLERNIAELEEKKAGHVALQSRLHGLGYSSLEALRATLGDLEVRSLSIRGAKQALQDTLATQRDVDLEDVYSQVARVWETFVGTDGWRVQLGRDGVPMLSDAKGRQFDLSQLSGGEKTALLVILHTIIARHFSRSDFLLIDEPLEHLDAVNRRSLVRFLTSAYNKDVFKQLIVTTVEESLTRKYIGEEGVSFIRLQ